MRWLTAAPLAAFVAAIVLLRAPQGSAAGSRGSTQHAAPADLAGPGPGRAAGATTSLDRDELEASLGAFFTEQMAALHIPGAVVSVVSGGEVLLAKGYGFANLEQQTPMGAQDSVVRIGSVSKSFVGTAVMRLVEQGRLDLQRDVTAYLPGFRVRGHITGAVTLAQLLTHTAGFGDFNYSVRDPSLVPALGPYLARHMPPRVMPPGQAMSYNSHGYALAAYVVESVSGIPFDRYVRESILLPLGMTDSGYLTPSAQVPPDLAEGYLFDGGRQTPLGVDYDGDYPGGSLFSTAADMGRFMIALSRDGCWEGSCILRPETVAEMLRNQFTHHPDLNGQGYGFVRGRRDGLDLVGHSGAIRGFGSLLELVPEQDVAVFLSFNEECAGTSACSLLEALRTQLYGQFRPPSASAPAAYVGPSDAARVAGVYRLNRYEYHTVNKIAVLSYDTTVTARPGGIAVGGTEYVQVGPLLFQAVDGQRHLAFREDADGRTTHMFQDWLAYDKLAWYQTGRFQNLLFHGFGWLWGALALVWPAELAYRRMRRRPLPPAPVPLAQWLAAAVALLDVVFLNGLTRLFWTSQAAKVGLLTLPLASLVVTVLLLAAVAVVWLWRRGACARRLYLSGFVLLAAAFLVFLRDWNLLGFHFG